MTRSLPLLAALALGVGMAGGALLTDALLDRTGPPAPSAAPSARAPARPGPDPALERSVGFEARRRAAPGEPRVWTPSHGDASRG